MSCYFVSRHAGAVDWARDQGIEATLIEHLDPTLIKAGDMVLGTLPIHLVAAITAKGARYLHLELEVPLAQRGEPLSASAMVRYGAKLVEYRAERITSGSSGVGS